VTERFKRLHGIARHYALAELGLVQADAAQRQTLRARQRADAQKRQADRAYIRSSLRRVHDAIVTASAQGRRTTDVHLERRDYDANTAICETLRYCGYAAQTLPSCSANVDYATTLRVAWPPEGA